MQKKIIALAVAGLVSGAAFAQSNVSIYGIVDAAYVNASGAGKHFAGVESGIMAGSRLGFKGAEDLGGGMKAVFALEYALNVDQNAGVGAIAGSATALAARQQWVGLSSGFGTVAFGRQYAPGYYQTIANDVTEANLYGHVATLSAAGGHTILAASPARWNNAVTYTSDKISGFTGRAAYGFGQTSENSPISDTRKGVGLNYGNGPLNADFVYHTQQALTGAKKNEWYMGAKYDLGMVAVAGSYQRLDDTAVTNVDNKMWQMGVIVPVGQAGKFRVGYGQLKWDNLANSTSKSSAVEYTHALSKRTTLYTIFNSTNNESGVVTAAGAAVTGGIAAKNDRNHTLALGVNHVF